MFSLALPICLTVAIWAWALWPTLSMGTREFDVFWELSLRGIIGIIGTLAVWLLWALARLGGWA